MSPAMLALPVTVQKILYPDHILMKKKDFCQLMIRDTREFVQLY